MYLEHPPAHPEIRHDAALPCPSRTYRNGSEFEDMDSETYRGLDCEA